MPKEAVAALSSAGEAVLGIAVLVGVGAWSGMWLDDKLHTTPWLAICLALLGMSLGLARMVMKAIQADKESSGGSGSAASKKPEAFKRFDDKD